MARWRPAMHGGGQAMGEEDVEEDTLYYRVPINRTVNPDLPRRWSQSLFSKASCGGCHISHPRQRHLIRSRRSRTRGGLLDVSAITVGGQRRHGNGGIDWSPTQSMPSTRRPLSLAAASSRRASRFFSSLSDTEQARSCLHELQPWSQMDCKTIQRVLLSCHHMPYHQVRCLRLRLVKTNSVRRSRGGLFRPSHAH